MKIAIQMDHISSINVEGDSSFAILLEAQSRGYDIYHYTPDKLSFDGYNVYARVEKITVKNDAEHFTILSREKINLSTVDVVLLRQDPPFNMNYITTTYLLETISNKTLILNDPFWVRNCPEKLFVMNFAKYMPETIIARDIIDVEEFREKHQDIIIKPLYGNGGAGVFFLGKNDKNLPSLIEIFDSFYGEPFVVQQYLAAVTEGDKRIILIDGEPVGAINRVASENNLRSNMHVGGKAVKTIITAEEKQICEAIAPWLKERNLYFTGIDIIGNKITEINVTSPTGIREVKEFGGNDIAKIFWDNIIKKLKSPHS